MKYTSLVLYFVAGFLIGVSLHFIILPDMNEHANECKYKKYKKVIDIITNDNNKNTKPLKHDKTRLKVDVDQTLLNITVQKNLALYHNQDLLFPHTKTYKARKLSKSIRILCWVMTYPKVLEKKARVVKETWGRHCNVLLFMSSKENKTFPTVGLNVGAEEYLSIWLKTKAAWNYVYENHYNEADWFMKADDDTYVIVENLRRFLTTFDTTKAHFLGRNFIVDNFNSGGAGHVLSKKALEEFSKISTDESKCPKDSTAEDVALSQCLKNANIFPGYTRDVDEREKFHPYTADRMITGGVPAWVKTYDRYKMKKGFQCCSKHSISFHYVVPTEMMAYEYLIYHLKVFGVEKHFDNVN